MRVNGRTLRPSTLPERRLLLSLGTAALRVPRDQNPFQVARRLRRLANGQGDDMIFARTLAQKTNKHVPPRPSPDLDSPFPIEPSTHA